MNSASIRRIVRGAIVALIVGSWVMVPLGFVSYSSFGMGRDEVHDPEMHHFYCRLRWPGDGSVVVGGGVEIYPVDADEPDLIDFAFRMFDPPRDHGTGTFWSRLGFRRYEDRTLGPKVLRHESSWIGVPSLLPPLILTGAWVWWRRRRRGHASGGS